MKYKVFIDGKEGTTGLRIYDRLAKRTDIERIPKAYLSSKEPKDLMNYSLLSQLRAEKTKALKDLRDGLFGNKS